MAIDNNNKTKLIKMEVWQEHVNTELKDIKETLTRMFETDGVCDSRHRKTGYILTTLKIHWVLFAALLGVLIKIAWPK